MLIGLTGRYCAGKNHVAAILAARGFQVLDVDKLGHRAIEEERDAIIARFGTGILRADGAIDRKKLGELVFPNPSELAALEAIVHPAANRLIEQWAAERSGADLVINAALLHRSTLLSRFDCILMVVAPMPTRFLRAMRRDKLPVSAVIKRFRSQKNFETQYCENKTDIYIVRNKGIFGPCAATRSRALERRIDSILTRIGMVR
jgi:dephospho-CoA kinase